MNCLLSFRPHRDEIRGVQVWRGYESACPRPGALPWNITTEVLYRCRRCGRPRTRNLRGEWTAKEVAG